MNSDCINIFNESIRNELFFCWAGIIATLVVFVAEAIKDNENILSKKLILKKSKIREAIISIIIIMLLLWGSSIISENRIYRILQSIISIVLLLLFVLTIKHFSELIKILIDKDYYSSETVKYAEMINNKYNNQSDKLNNNCIEVNKNIIQLYRNKNGDYDVNLIEEYLNYLYEIKNKKSYEHFYTQIENEYSKNRKEKNETNINALLKELSNVARKNKDEENFKKYSHLLTYEYISKIERNNIEKNELTLNFINKIYTYSFINNDSDEIKYYDITLSCILIFIYKISKISGFKSIQVINENIIKFNENYLDLNYQFLYGFSRYLIVANKSNKVNNNEKNDASSEINKLICDFFLKIYPDNEYSNVHDISTFITKFKELYNENSSIQQTYDNCESFIYDDNYHNLFSWSVISEFEILSNLLKILSSNLYDIKDINSNSINKDDALFFDSLKKNYERLVNKNENENDKQILNVIDKMYEIAEQKRKDFIIKSEIDFEKAQKIVNQLEKNIFECNNLLKYIKKESKLVVRCINEFDSNVKIQFINKIYKKIFYQKEIFVEDYIYVGNEETSSKISNIIEDLYLNNIKSKCIKFEKISDIENDVLSDDDIVLIDINIYFDLFDIIKNNKILINNKEYVYITVNNINAIWVINKNEIKTIYLFNECKDDKAAFKSDFIYLYESSDKTKCEIICDLNMYVETDE